MNQNIHNFIQQNKILNKNYKENENKFNYENNIHTFFLNFILKKNSKVLQLGNIDNSTEEFIKNKIDKKYYIKKEDVNFNFNKLQNNIGFHFDILIISHFHKTYEFTMMYSSVYKQIKSIYFYYNFKTKLCDAVRRPFLKQNFHTNLYIELNKFDNYQKITNIGAIHKNKKILCEILKKGDIKGENELFKFSYGKDISSSCSIINHLIYKYKLNNYLEIGVEDGTTFNKINIKNKIGIDPIPSKECLYKNIYLMTSDEYFEFNNKQNKFDIIFIDGSKIESQVNKDIQNSLSILSDKGFIILKNCNPLRKINQRNSFFLDGKYLPWNGTVWRSYANLRMNNPKLKMNVINCDWGIGIIQNGKQECYKKIDDLKFNHLDGDRYNLLNLISIYDFLKEY